MQIDTSVRSPNWSKRTKPIDMLVLHATAGSAASALGWLCNPASKVSAHYLVAKTGYAWQLVPDGRVAWHAGQSSWQGRSDCNAYSVGIEIENANTGKDPYPEIQYQAVLALSRQIVAAHGIRRDRVVRHCDIAPERKTDPRGFAWDRFLAELFAVALPPAAQHYRARAYCYVRAKPDTKAARTGELLKGQEVAGALVEGAYFANSWGAGSYWVTFGEDRFVWAPQMEAV